MFSFVALQLAVCAFGAETNALLKTEAYVSVRSTVPIKIESAADGVRVVYAVTKDAEGEKKISRLYRNNKADAWEDVRVRFSAPEDCSAILAFSGVPAVGKDKKVFVPGVCYDDVRLNGEQLPNGGFEKNFSVWNLDGYKNSPLRIIAKEGQAKEGLKYMRTGANRYVSQKLSLKKGVVYELAFSTRPAGAVAEESADSFLDIAGLANFGLSDWKAYGARLDLSKLDVSRKDFGGVRFSLIDSAKNGGNAAALLKSKGKIEIPASDFGSFVYLLHTSFYSGGGADVNGAVIINCEDGVSARYQIFRRRDTWMFEDARTFCANLKRVYSVDEKKNLGNLYISKFKIPEGSLVKSVEIESCGNDKIVLLAATVSNSDIPMFDTVVCDEKNWTSADIPENLYVKEGSALDQSVFFDKSFSGELGRVVVSERGTLAFEKKPDEDARFKGFSETSFSYFISLPKEKRHREIDRFAKSFKVNGYNFARISFGGMLKYKNTNPARYDELYEIADYYIAAMKRNGVYIHHPWWMVPVEGYNFYIRDDVKLRAVFGEPEVLRLWKENAEDNLNHVNQYTKIAWKDDPVFACFELYNELAICFSRMDKASKFDPRDTILPETEAFVLGKWRAWLKETYKGDISALNKKWTAEYFNNRRKFEYKSFEDVECVVRGNPDWDRCCWDHMKEFIRFGKKVMADTGYKGLVVQNNLGTPMYAIDVRYHTTDYVIGNTYFAHPSSFNLNSGSVSQGSSIDSRAGYWRGITSSKLNNRPYFISEYNHCFWNKYRYEFPAMFASYSAFQNFSGLIIHQDAVPLRPTRPKLISFFQVEQSPVARAAELYSSAMFIRGDVKKAKHRVDLKISNKFLENTALSMKGVNSLQTQLLLLTGFTATFDGECPESLKGVKIPKADITITPVGGSEILSEAWFHSVVEDPNNQTFNLEKFTQVLREKKILPEDNITDVSKGIFQSETGQITMDSTKKTLKVVTPRSEIVAAEKFEPVKLGALKVISSTVPASVGVVSLDGKKISNSKRLMFTYATRESNIGMKLSPDEVISAGSGSGPIALLNGTVEAELKLLPDGKYSIYPLSLTGERRDPIPFEFADGVMKIKIDNSKLKNGSTVFFEIVAE